MSNSKEIVTSDKYAADVMSYVHRHGGLFCAELQKEAEKTWSLAPDEITTLRHEIFLALLWAASKALAPDRNVVDSLHYSYFQRCYRSGATYEESAARVGAAQLELSDRYEQYHKAWDHEQTSYGMALGFEMSQFFFPRHRPVCTKLHFLVESNIQTFIQNLLQFRGQFELWG
jgi:hypothetical protein